MSIEQDKLLAYLDNQLSDVEKTKVEDALSKDPALVAQLATYKEMNEFLSVKNAKTAALNNLKEVHAEMKSSPAIKPDSSTTQEVVEVENEGRGIKSILKLLALVIGAIAFFYLGYQFINKGVGQVKPTEAPELLYAANFDPDDISFTSRGEFAEASLVTAASAFNQEDYAGAIALFEKAEEKAALNPRATYSYSIALIGVGQTEKGRGLLEGLKDSNPIYKDDALWYIAMSHLAEGQKQGDNVEARSALAGISKTSKWYKQAFSLLDDLGE